MPLASKSELRRAAREKRRQFPHPDIGAARPPHAPALNLPRGTIVGGYHALPGEADPALLLGRLAAQGCRIAFPRMVARDLPLEFHLVPDGEMLKLGAHGIHEPRSDWPSVMPHLLLVPLLAFDKSGHRLGYGGGFYDRTLAAYGIRAIGLAYAAQEMESLPAEAHDMKLDGVLTERGLTLY